MLADILPALQETRLERRPLTNTEKCMRWRRANRKQWNAYRRAWRAMKKLTK